MPDSEHDTTEEQAILGRLALAHKEWRARRPMPPPPLSAEEQTARIERILQEWNNRPEPQDVRIIHEAREDALRAIIWSQLSVVGWRLYAKGGLDMLTEFYRAIEHQQHPGFAAEVFNAWSDIGFSDDPSGRWSGIRLL